MKNATKITATGRPKGEPYHPVNPPVERASSYLFPTYDNFLDGAKNIVYGRLGGTTHRALEEAVTALEGGVETRLAPSGLQACVASLLAFVEAGDHVLVADTVYDPTRKFCDNFLRRFGVETSYYDPLASSDEIKALLQERTKVIFAESPGSQTFEVQDLPMLASLAEDTGAKLVVDNTWAAGYFCKPIKLGAHVSVQAATKYMVGHADCLVGTITSADEKTAKSIYYALLQLGSNVSADDAYLTLRGLRTLPTRLARHEENGLALAKWLSKRPEVKRVIHPALRGAPGHTIWKRDFTGSSGLFSIVLKPVPNAKIAEFFNAFKLFSAGFSWGGFESLALHVRPDQYRTASPWTEEGPLVRIHAGLEDIDDLKVDLERALTAFTKS